VYDISTSAVQQIDSNSRVLITWKISEVNKSNTTVILKIYSNRGEVHRSLGLNAVTGMAKRFCAVCVILNGEHVIN
jgi:hypothetical protein